MSQNLSSEVPSLSPFIFQNHPIRTQLEGDTLWFVAKDVCTALDISWSSATLKPIPAEWQRGIKFITPQGFQTLKTITEPAVYKLAFRSNKPEADAFTNWIASEVVPSIRKTGKYEIQAAPDTPITPDQQCTLQAMVKALVEKGGHYANIWSRFNNHFRIARYCQLPQSRMSEAVDYLMRLPVEPKKLPPSPTVAKNATVGIAAGGLLPSTPGEMDKRRERICRDLYALQDKFGALIDEIRLCLHPGARWAKLPPELDAAYETLDALNRVAAGGAYTARQAIVSAYQIGKGLRFI